MNYKKNKQLPYGSYQDVYVDLNNRLLELNRSDLRVFLTNNVWMVKEPDYSMFKAFKLY